MRTSNITQLKLESRLSLAPKAMAVLYSSLAVLLVTCVLHIFSYTHTYSTKPFSYNARTKTLQRVFKNRGHEQQTRSPTVLSAGVKETLFQQFNKRFVIQKREDRDPKTETEKLIG
jgi:hypothetical protein